MEKTRLEVIEELARLGSGNTQSLLGRAYDAGRLDGFEQGRREIAAQMQSILARVPTKGQPPVVSNGTPSRAKVENRAAPGSVRPAIEGVMEKEARGLKTEEVLKLVHATGRTDIKANTVRGTLNTLKGKGAVEKRGGYWFLVATKAKPSVLEALDNILEMNNMPN